MKPTIAVVGGFLGAGKTTLILTAARLLQQRGLRVAVILNDQGDDLVDTYYAAAQSVACDQVTGGCFCCRFPDLVEAAGRLREISPTSSSPRPWAVARISWPPPCARSSATTGPLPRRATDRGSAPAAPFDNPDLDFLTGTNWPKPTSSLGACSLQGYAATGESVAEWIDGILSGALPAGANTLDIDYARYAEAEAALAWLNARVTAQAAPPISAPMLVGPLLDRLEPQIHIVHLKLFTQSDAGYLKAALTATDTTRSSKAHSTPRPPPNTKF